MDSIFSKIDESNSITVNLFKRLLRVIQALSIFLKDRKDQKIKDWKKDHKVEFPTLHDMHPLF